MKMIDRALLTLLALITAGAMTGCEDSKTNTTTDGRGGLKLLSYTQKSYDREGKKSRSTKINFHYDEQGRLVKLIKDGQTHIYKYDEKGRNISKYNAKYPQYGVKYLYDDAGNVIKKTVANYDTRYGSYYETVTTYKYDTSTKLPKPATNAHQWVADAYSPLILRKVDSNGDGIFDETRSYTYNEHGDCVNWKIISKGHGKTYIGNGNSKYTYKNGRISKASYSFTYEYIPSEDNSTHESHGIVYYTYDSSGNKISEEYRDDDDTILQQNKYTYDEYGNEISKRSFGGDGKLIEETIRTWGTPEEEDSEANLPDFYGYGTIQIYSHLKKGTQLYETYAKQEIAGTEKAFYHGNASCSDYGFTNKDLQNTTTASDIRYRTYFNGHQSCFETEVLSSHPMYGNESILFGKPSKTI